MLEAIITYISVLKSHIYITEFPLYFQWKQEAKDFFFSVLLELNFDNRCF